MKLYVGNLPYNISKEELEQTFAAFGAVSSARIVNDRETGRSKGFGFVEMATEEGAQEAIKRFNGYTLDKRNLTVNEARPREERSGGGYSGGRRDREDRAGGSRGGYGGGSRGSRDRF